MPLVMFSEWQGPGFGDRESLDLQLVGAWRGEGRLLKLLTFQWQADQSHGAALIHFPEHQVPSSAHPKPGALLPCAWCFSTNTVSLCFPPES